MKSARLQDGQGMVVEHLVMRERKLQQRIGGKKLYRMLKPELTDRNIFIGRDKFLGFLRRNHLNVPKSKNHTKTTMSYHRFFKYPNLIKDLKLIRPEQLWVSDITYIKTRKETLYLSLITDAFSKQIMGYHLADHLRTDGPLRALKMALRNRQYPGRRLIHHSDRGFQYCDPKYTDVLNQHDVKISMTTKYDPRENAIAERVNGIIKNELLVLDVLPSTLYAHKAIKQAIKIYNTRRPHLTLHDRTPQQAHRFPFFKLKVWKKHLIKAN
jgi:transposase InsO family protein